MASGHRRSSLPLPTPDHNNPNLADIVETNVHKIIALRKEQEKSETFQERIADWLTALSGSIPFAYIHALWFIVWVIINVGWTPLPKFDPFPFGLLTLIVSLEAIFLSTFVLISQNRQAAIQDQRADLDLHINLLAEHEITRILKLVDAIADHMGLAEGEDKEVDELKKDVAPEMVLEEIEQWEDHEGFHVGRKPRKK
jgi:uncharacterized membrane protein